MAGEPFYAEALKPIGEINKKHHGGTMYKRSLFLVVLAILTLPVFAIQPDAAKGFNEIEKVPADKAHRYFCQTSPGEEGVVLDEELTDKAWQHSVCKELVKKMKDRLEKLSTGELPDVLDPAFIKEIAHAWDEKNNGYRSINIYHTVMPLNEESLLELHRVANEIYRLSGSELHTIYFSPDYHKRVEGEAFKNIKSPNEFPVKYELHGMDIGSISKFIDNFTAKINAMMKNLSAEDDLAAVEREIVFYSKVFLVAQPFIDGNTKTTLIVMNLMRAYLGLAPYDGYSLPDLRDNSSSFIQNSFASE